MPLSAPPDPLPPPCSSLAACASAGARLRRRPADLVVYGRVWTGDSARPWARRVAVAGRHGSPRSATARPSRALAGPATRVLDNGAAMVVPGFMDGHTCTSPTAASSSPASTSGRPTRPRSSSPGSRRYATERRPGEWILGGELGPRALARRPAPAPRVDRLGDAEQPGVRVPARRAHGAGQHAPRSGRPGSRGRRGTSPAASSCATRAPASRPASLKDMAMGPVERAVPDPTDGAARRGPAPGAGLRGVARASPPSRT